MAMKNKKTRNKGRRLSSILRDNKGIETRVLIYVIAAVVLIAALSIALQITSTGNLLTGIGLKKAAADMKKSITDEDGNPLEGMSDSVDKLNEIITPEGTE